MPSGTLTVVENPDVVTIPTPAASGALRVTEASDIPKLAMTTVNDPSQPLTVAEFRILFPAFSATTPPIADATIQMWLDLAPLDPCIWGPRYQLGMGLWAAHELAKFASTVGMPLDEFRRQFEYLVDFEPPPLLVDARGETRK